MEKRRRRPAGLRPYPRPTLRTIDFFTITSASTVKKAEKAKHKEKVEEEGEALRQLGLPVAFGGGKRKAEQPAKQKRRKGGSKQDACAVLGELPHIDYEVVEIDEVLVNHRWTFSVEALLGLDPLPMLHSSQSCIDESSALAMEKSQRVEVEGPDGQMIKVLPRYWHQRESLFSLYSQGCQLDEEGWFSVTPECIAQHQARILVEGAGETETETEREREGEREGMRVIDGFAGVGGNAIQFALAGAQVMAIELEADRLRLAQENARIYGASPWIQWTANDTLKLLPFLQADWIFGSPPWGGPAYLAQSCFDPRTLPVDLAEFIRLAWGQATRGLCLFLPRHTHLPTFAHMLAENGIYSTFTVELHQMGGRDKALTVYLDK